MELETKVLRFRPMQTDTREIQQWEKQEGVLFSHIFFLSGTGFTQCGLVSGKTLE
ncbi:MAG: hypothetical protein V8T31_09885 [Lachnospiraceae bacterium]